MLQRLTVFLLTTAISTFCVANENNKLDLSGLSNEKIAAAEEYYEAGNVEGVTMDSMDAMFPMMLQAVKQQTGVAPPTEFVTILKSTVDRAMDEAFLKNGTLRDIFIIVNAEYFSTEELAELAAFYKTPVGVKFTKFASKAGSRVTELMMPIMVEVQGQFPEMMIKEAIDFCKTKNESDFCKVIPESA